MNPFIKNSINKYCLIITLLFVSVLLFSCSKEGTYAGFDNYEETSVWIYSNTCFGMSPMVHNGFYVIAATKQTIGFFSVYKIKNGFSICDGNVLSFNKADFVPTKNDKILISQDAVIREIKKDKNDNLTKIVINSIYKNIFSLRLDIYTKMYSIKSNINIENILNIYKKTNSIPTSLASISPILANKINFKKVNKGNKKIVLIKNMVRLLRDIKNKNVESAIDEYKNFNKSFRKIIISEEIFNKKYIGLAKIYIKGEDSEVGLGWDNFIKDNYLDMLLYFKMRDIFKNKMENSSKSELGNLSREFAVLRRVNLFIYNSLLLNYNIKDWSWNKRFFDGYGDLPYINLSIPDISEYRYNGISKRKLHTKDETKYGFLLIKAYMDNNKINSKIADINKLKKYVEKVKSFSKKIGLTKSIWQMSFEQTASYSYPQISEVVEENIRNMFDSGVLKTKSDLKREIKRLNLLFDIKNEFFLMNEERWSHFMFSAQGE